MTLVQPVTYDNPKNGPTDSPEGRDNPVTEKATATEQQIPLEAGGVADRDQAARNPTAAGATSTPRIRWRIRRLFPTSWRPWRSLLIPAALCYTFGKMVGDTILAAMTIVFVALLATEYVLERPATRC